MQHIKFNDVPYSAVLYIIMSDKCICIGVNIIDYSSYLHLAFFRGGQCKGSWAQGERQKVPVVLKLLRGEQKSKILNYKKYSGKFQEKFH